MASEVRGLQQFRTGDARHRLITASGRGTIPSLLRWADKATHWGVAGATVTTAAYRPEQPDAESRERYAPGSGFALVV